MSTHSLFCQKSAAICLKIKTYWPFSPAFVRHDAAGHSCSRHRSQLTSANDCFLDVCFFVRLLSRVLEIGVGRTDGRMCRRGAGWTVSHNRIALEKSPPADNLPTKIRPARRLPGQNGLLPVNCRPGETFLRGDPIMKIDFYGGDNILMRSRHIDSVIISPPADFSCGKLFNVTSAAERANDVVVVVGEICLVFRSSRRSFRPASISH